MTTFYSRVVAILRGQLPEDLLKWLPRGWKRIGHIAVLSLHETLIPYRAVIGEACLSFLRGVQTITMKVGPTVGTFRTPQLEVIAGDPRTETLHKEHGCLFELDAAYLTFSSGNHFERKRMIEMVKEGAAVVDMFACVGNLSLPLAVHNRVQVIGIEINPLAFKYLSRNIKRNKIEGSYHPRLGDNRGFTPTNWADHVIMGCWNCDNLQILRGIEALKADCGGWIHFHEVVPPRKSSSALFRFVKCLKMTSLGFVVGQTHTRRVKTVGPQFFHVVTDLRLVPV